MIFDCVQYQAGARTASATTITDAARLAREGSGFVWLAVSEAEPEELRELGASFAVPPLAVEDALQHHPRPKLREHGETASVIAKSVHIDASTHDLQSREVDILVGPRYAIVVSASGAEFLVGVRARLDEHPDIAALGPTAALWAVLETVIGDAERVLDDLGDRGEQLATLVFEGDRDQSEPIYDEQHTVERLARGLHPALALFDALERSDLLTSAEPVRRLVRNVSDRARRLSEEVTMLSSGLDGLLNANLARVTVHQNVIIQQVSAWAAIAAAPTIIAGIYGMNFRHFPELGWLVGYPFAIAVMVVAVLFLRWNFRRVGWL